ncbi:MAG: NAD(P)-binding protein [Acidimicrobiales bacterium]
MNCGNTTLPAIARKVPLGHPHIVGDATEDAVLRRAGIERAKGRAAVTASDATNVYLTLSGRSRSPKLFIVARARVADSEPKLIRAGPDRAVNPQAIGTHEQLGALGLLSPVQVG